MELAHTGVAYAGYSSRRRYASLYFLACVDEDDNELIVLETIHHFVEVSGSSQKHGTLVFTPSCSFCMRRRRVQQPAARACK